MPENNLNQLIKQSIQSALSKNWNQASVLNQKILKINPKNIDALNRLAKAKIELKDYKEAQIILKKVLTLDKFNPIAKANLEKTRPSHTSSISKTDTTPSGKKQIVSFIEEPGKTKTVTLVNLGERQTLNCLQSGEEVILHPLKRKIKVLSFNKKYLGSLPEDISITLAQHIKLGSKFHSFIKSCHPKQINIFIKEIKKSNRLKGAAPFAPNKHKKHSILKHHPPMNSPLQIYDPKNETNE